MRILVSLKWYFMYPAGTVACGCPRPPRCPCARSPRRASPAFNAYLPFDCTLPLSAFEAAHTRFNPYIATLFIAYSSFASKHSRGFPSGPGLAVLRCRSISSSAQAQTTVALLLNVLEQTVIASRLSCRWILPPSPSILHWEPTCVASLPCPATFRSHLFAIQAAPQNAFTAAYFPILTYVYTPIVSLHKIAYGLHSKWLILRGGIEGQ